MDDGVVEAVNPPSQSSPPLSPWFPPPATTRRKGSRRWLLITLVVLFVFATVGAGGGYVVNRSLSAQYSPQRAVVDYFTAQARGDVAGMMANSTYLRGDGSYSLFFNTGGVEEMLTVAQNKQITDLHVLATERVNDLTSTVRVSMSWAGNQRTHTYTVKRDDTRVHDLFYYSWRVEIPFATINLKLPAQAGVIELDNQALPTGAPQDSIITIEGYHNVTMDKTAFYDSSTQLADAVDGTPFITFDGKISSAATESARAAVRVAFNSCDAGKSWACLNHTYYAPNNPGYFYFLTMPGYPQIIYTSYVFTLRGDPAADMKLVIMPEFGELTAAGSCAVTMTVDGSAKYYFSGSWTGVLTAGGDGFTAHVIFNCVVRKG